MFEEMNDFAAHFLAPEKPLRDSGGRPLLVPAGHNPQMCSACANQGNEDGHRVAYSRASGLGDILEEFGFLWKWKMRGLAVGLSRRMDLVRLVAAESYTCGFTEDEAANRASGRRVDQVIDRAMDVGGVDMKADYGTAIHARTEPGNTGTDPDEKQQQDQQSCWDLWARLGVTHLGTEVFTANDTLRTAGTFDHLSYVPGYGIIITDKKTSSKAKSTYDIQFSVYAYGDVYDIETDERMTLEEYVASLGWDPGLINRSVGIIWWVKNGKTEARLVDIDNGWKWAKVAAEIRDDRRTQGVAKNVTKSIESRVVAHRAELLEMINSSRDADEILSYWNTPNYRSVWTDEHTAAAKAKKEAL